LKLLDIATKDLLRTLRTPFALIMMFVAPLLIAALLFFAFGSLAGGDGELEVQRIQLQVANADQPGSQAGGFAAGAMLVDFLESEDLQDLLAVEVAPDAASARAAVDARRADVAVLIPPDFSDAVFSVGGQAAVALYPDPTLTIAPGIVQDLVRQFVDGFAGAKITADVVARQFESQGTPAGNALLQEAATRYADWLETKDHQEGGAPSSIDLRLLSGEAGTTSPGLSLIGGVMAGMLVFFTFFMGALGAESIVREDEAGTLSRLFTTPTPLASILGGKFAAIIFTLVVQILVLLGASALLFGIGWGQPLSVTLAAAGLIVAAAGFGVLIMSFTRTTRQTGPVMGVVLTLTGMLGGLFTTAIPNVPGFFDVVYLTVPQGWALRAWELSLEGAGPADLVLPSAVLFAFGTLFLALGARLFRRRFA
jgi:ABC-2 type transport system permease protein